MTLSKWTVNIMNEHMKAKNSFHIYAMITILFWSLAYVLTRLSLQYFTPFSLGFLRYFIASCTLIIVAVISKIKLPHKKDLPWFMLAGALGFFFYMIAFNQGQKTVTASTGSIVISTVPVLTALITFSIFFGTILLAVFIQVSVGEAINAPAIQWFYLAILGIFSSAIAYVAWSRAFAKAEQTSQVSNYMFITPFLTSVLGFIIADEVPEPSTIVGGGIILSGVFLFNFGGKLYGALCNMKNTI